MKDITEMPGHCFEDQPGHECMTIGATCIGSGEDVYAFLAKWRMTTEVEGE